MKAAYKQELVEVYSKKMEIDEKMKKKLKKAQSLDKKKEVVESFIQEREEDKVDIEGLSSIRQPYIRMSDYFNKIDDDIKSLYEKYNEFKLNKLYENINANEFTAEALQTEMDRYEKEIDEKKQLKIKQILKKNEKKEVMDKKINDLKLKISERKQEYNESDSIEDKKRIYNETVPLKFELFEIFRKNISIVNIESKTGDSVNKYSTTVIDYLPIKNNQKKLTGKSQMGEVEEKPVELGEVELKEVELGEVELGEVEPPSPEYKASENF
jgi:hypothetical protein